MAGFRKTLIIDPSGTDEMIGGILAVQRGEMMAEAAADIVASLSEAEREAWFVHAGYLKALEIWKPQREPTANRAAAVKAAVAEYRKATRAATGDTPEAETVRAAALVRL